VSQSKIDECYSKEDNKEALDCLRELVQQPSPCRLRLVLFTQENCQSCKSEAKRYSDDIKAGIIEEVSLDSPEGTRIAMKNGIDFVPSLVVLDCHDNLIEPSV